MNKEKQIICSKLSLIIIILGCLITITGEIILGLSQSIIGLWLYSIINEKEKEKIKEVKNFG